MSLADDWVTTVGDQGGVLSGTKAVAMFLLLAVTKGGALLACRKLQMSVGLECTSHIALGRVVRPNMAHVQEEEEVVSRLDTTLAWC